MSKCIKIKSCNECHHRDHQGGFGKIAYIPCCRFGKGRELPYTTSANQRGYVTATCTGVIPEWCPLDDLPDDTQYPPTKIQLARHRIKMFFARPDKKVKR